MNLRKDDTVVVISGDNKGAQGKIVAVSPEERKVIVAGVNLVSKHVKPRKQGEAGGIVKAEGALYADKVMIVCSKCKKGVRIKHAIEDGKKVRVCAKCGAKL